jgi:hypothetical protein
MPAFKSDESFLEKISMGATGTLKVVANLAAAGHRPIELERFSTNFKIWKNIKIKRIRVPDILCLACSHRVESRTKSAFEISMSHSLADPERGWDFGLTDGDFVAIVVSERAGPRPIDWRALDPVQYISVADLREAYKVGRVITLKPKGAQEGFELRIVWPSAAAGYEGLISSVDAKRVQYRRTLDKRTISVALARKNGPMVPLVPVGQHVIPYQALAAVVPVMRSFACSTSATEATYIDDLGVSSLSYRYAAAKALAHFSSAAAAAALRQKLDDEHEHIYIRLECAAGLARLGDEAGWAFIEHCLADEYPQHRLEAVIILAEIPHDRSCSQLSDIVRDRSQLADIRAGAAWALGEMKNRSALDALIESFSEANDLLRVEAARALAKLSMKFSADVLQAFPRSTADRRAGIAWALNKAGTFEIRDVLSMLVDEDARQWIAYMVGSQDQGRMLTDIEMLRERDPEIYFAVTVLWKIMTSWIYQLETYG